MEPGLSDLLSLETVLGSVQQTPLFVLDSWCKESANGVEDEIRSLIARHGENTTLWNYETRSPNFRKITPLERLAEVAE